MGTLNCTPDSFSDGGQFPDSTAAVKEGKTLVSDGAHLLDIGGESTAPGRTPVDSDTELARIQDVVATLSAVVPVSVDTYKASVAEKCLSLGASVINDVTALRADAALAEVIREHQAALVLMYSKQAGDTPQADSTEKEYQDVVETICNFLSERVEFALSKGIKESQIILDPGMGGFLSPNPKYSWEVIRRMPEIEERFAGFPILIGTSRKGFLGGSLESRDPSSQLSALLAYESGADILRTHNVGMAVEFVRVWKKCGGRN